MLNSVLNVKAPVGAFIQEKALVIVKFREPSLETLPVIVSSGAAPARVWGAGATIVGGHADQIAVPSSILAAVAKTTRGVCC